jgi:hypothetical protein
VSTVRCDYELVRDGPYVSVILPDVLPPDWAAVKRDIESEIDDGAERVMFMPGDARGDVYDLGVQALVSGFEAEGIETIVIWQAEPAAFV